MKRALVAVGAALLLACAAPAILGGGTPATRSHRCEDGTRCPNGYDCPPLAGGRCEASFAPPMTWGEEGVGAHRDAGDAD